MVGASITYIELSFLLFFSVELVYSSRGSRGIANTRPSTPSSLWFTSRSESLDRKEEMQTHLVQRAKGINFHDCEIISENDVGRDINNMRWLVPEVWEEFKCACRQQPDEV